MELSHSFPDPPVDPPLSRRGFCSSAAAAGLAVLLDLDAAGAEPAGREEPLDADSKAELHSALGPMTADMIRYFLENRTPSASAPGGLVLDRVSAAHACGPAVSTNPDVASAAATGYGLAALILAVEDGLAARGEAAADALEILRRTAGWNRACSGWLYHFMNGVTGEPAIGSEISSIDTAIFYWGALAAGDYFGGGVKDQALAMFGDLDFNVMLAEDGRRLRHGFKHDGDSLKPLSACWDAYSEGVMLYLLGLGSASHPLAAECWGCWNREERWSYAGYTAFLPLPLFTYYYPLGFLPLRGVRDRDGLDFWEKARSAALMQSAFCRDSGYPEGLFGLTACDGPTKEGGVCYREYYPGHSHADKTVSPLAMLACLPLAERECYAAFRQLKRLGLLNFRYGPAAAFDPQSGWSAPETLGIDVGSTLLMLDAYGPGVIHGLMRKNEVAQRGMERAGFRAAG